MFRKWWNITTCAPTWCMVFFRPSIQLPAFSWMTRLNPPLSAQLLSPGQTTSGIGWLIPSPWILVLALAYLAALSILDQFPLPPSYPNSTSEKHHVLDQVPLRAGTYEGQIRLWISKYLLLPKILQNNISEVCYKGF